MKYIDPKVILLDSSIPKLGYFTWLKSRQWVITNSDGEKFMVNATPDSDWYERLPEEFYVGTEKVNKRDYEVRIERMNLQYNNLEVMVYEIQGSCLFRDILFNINKIAQWAQSNRFLFSILSDDAIYDEDNYAVSSEYQGIVEWENQFQRYMMAINEDQVVDHNRLEMPYSISSTFWIGVNKKTLFDLLSFLRKYAPFFYEVYGKLFGISEDNLPSEPSSAITQYILKAPGQFKEMSVNIQGTQIVNSKMGLILYSQFIRQADTRVAGLYNEIIHEDAESFKHKVFKGGTILDIHYVADITKALSTVRTRLCAFAMSSGDDPCSWSYFINNFLPADLSPEAFKSMLPCQFDGCKLIDCKFKDDIKFRNEGKEVSNCPCPIFTRSLENAKVKKERDNNRIGDAYYDLTKYLIEGGTPFEFKGFYWDSVLQIKSDSELSKELTNSIVKKLKDWEVEYENYNKTGEYGKLQDKLLKYANMFPDHDFTCAMKGLAIDMMANTLNGSRINKYIINFGGDIYCHNVDANIAIDGTDFLIDVNYHNDWSIFTSGNTSKRGNHIKGCNPNEFTTVIVKWVDPTRYNNTIVDIISTKLAANEMKEFSSLLHEIRYLNFQSLIFDSISGKLKSPTYCASPFFNPTQVEIRDRMVSKFLNPFRPDLTPESDEYNVKKNYDAVLNVVNANIKGITESNYLVFPNRTTDLGTLWEVGHAIAYNRPIIKFDEESNKYLVELINEPNIRFKDMKGEFFMFDCTNKLDAISLGYLSKFVNPDKIYYQLKGMPDNIMLSVNYHHVEFDETGELVEYERDKEDEDR